MDPRFQKLADLLVRHSCRVQPGEHLLLELFDAPPAMAVALVEAVRAAGGHPHVELRSNRVMRALLRALPSFATPLTSAFFSRAAKSSYANPKRVLQTARLYKRRGRCEQRLTSAGRGRG